MNITPRTTVRPVIMNFTATSPIKCGDEYNAIYNHVTQTYVCMAKVNTMSMKTSMTKLGPSSCKSDNNKKVDDWKAK